MTCLCGAPTTETHTARGTFTTCMHCDRTRNAPCHAGVCACCRRYAHRLTARIAATTPVRPT